MAFPEFLTYTIGQLVHLLRGRKLSPVEVTQACLDRVQELNSSLCAYTAVLAEQALEQAREAERALARGMARSILHGVPVSVKDVYETRGIPTTWGAKDLAEYRPAEDSTVVTKLHEAGAILLGKTNVDAYPYHGGQWGQRLIGPTRNPWDLERTTGRSSGGSGAAVAAMLDYGSIGSDTAGSIRIPAAFCGVVGLKPTFGLVSKYRVFPYSYSFDHCGPLARSTHDCALLLHAITGHDSKDPTTVNRPVPDYTSGLEESVRGLRVGLPRAEAWESNQPEVTRLVEDAVSVLTGLGLEICEIDLPHLHDARWVSVVEALEISAMAEVMVSRERTADPYAAYLLLRDEAGRKRALDMGMQISQAAQLSYSEIFHSIDLIAMPTVPITAPRFTEVRSPWLRPGESFGEMVVRHTCIFNLVRYPAISIPCGIAGDGMPVGLQFAGRPFEEETVLRVAHHYEKATSWHFRHPSIS